MKRWWRSRRSSRSLEGKVVLVTGGSRGLGLLLARELLGEGCRVAICARDPDELDLARRQLAVSGREVMARACDVADPEDVQAVVDEIIARFGGLDMVLNNAGIAHVGPFDAMTMSDFARALTVTFWGALNVIWAARPHLRDGGRIVNVGSIGARVPVPHLLPRDCAKAALGALSAGLSAELAADGISVTTVLPGFVRTGSALHALFKGEPEQEFAWLADAGSSRLISNDAAVVARRIVAAAKRRRPEVAIGWQAKTLRLLQALSPRLVSWLMKRVARRLPSASTRDDGGWRGLDLTAKVPFILARRVDMAGRPLNQYGARPMT